MFPIFTPINREIYANIVSSGQGIRPTLSKQFASSELVPFVRVISGTGKGLIMQSNIDVPVISDIQNMKFDPKTGLLTNIKSSPALYGNRFKSGILGYNWAGEPVWAFELKKNSTTKDFVLKPSPIITDLEVKEGKDQISRHAKIVFKCFSLAQAEYIQEYMMEPGHSLLIEYGWNTDRALAQLLPLTNNNRSLSSKQISINAATSNLNYATLHQKRLTSEGDYDSFFGFIVGGDMTSDGSSFVITINLRGMPGLPSYLQLHQNINQIEQTKDKSGKVLSRKISRLPEAPLYGQSEITDVTDTHVSVSSRRWKWLFNKLPATRQTNEVQKVINEISSGKKDTFGYWDLINFDYNIANTITEFGNQDVWDTIKRFIGLEPEFQKNGVKVPQERLISENRYIRFERALDILNRNNGLMSYKIGNKNVRVRIQTRNYIGAFPKIFSTKPSKLIIPGKLPDFQKYYLNTDPVDINEILDSEVDNKIIGETVNVTKQVVSKKPTAAQMVVMQATGVQEFTVIEDVTSIAEEAISFVQYSQDGKGLRPSLVDPNNPNKGRFAGYYEKDGYYGELGNLYINFSVFFEALKNSSNKSVREVLMDMLNEMSSAVNSFWNFQIVEGTDSNGDYVLRIIDENWAGRNQMTVRSFVFTGESSPFLEANLTVDIPSETTNQIILKRQDYISNPDAKTISVGGIFSDKNDKFFTGVDYVKTIATGGTTGGAPPKAKTTSEDVKIEIEALLNSANITYKDNFKTDRLTTEGRDAAGSLIYTYTTGITPVTFTDYSNVRTNQNNSTGILLSQKIAEYQKLLTDEANAASTNLNANLARIDIQPNPEAFSITTDALDIDKNGLAAFRNNFRIYCCDDTQLFDILKNNAYEDYMLKESSATSHLLPIKFTFKVLGRSGIRRGDTFNIIGIPEKYRNNGFFQVITIEHNFTENKWTTTVVGQYRQQKRGG